MKVSLLALIAAVALPFLIHGPQVGFMTRAQSIDSRAEDIWSRAHPLLTSCGPETGLRARMIAKSLIAIEIDRTGPVEKFVENSLLKAAQLLSFPLPDLSYGIAQLRPSTLGQLSRDSAGQMELIEVLLGHCKSLDLAQRIVAKHYKNCLSSRMKNCHLQVARLFNGQQSVKHPNIAYLMVFEAVYRHAAGKHGF